VQPPRLHTPHDGPGRSLAPGPFLCAMQFGTVSHAPHYLQEQGDSMPHWRKRNPPASRFNAYLAGWAIAVALGTLVVLSIRRHV
jgi:hypothetical protein